jgi:hypothetical protein
MAKSQLASVYVRKSDYIVESSCWTTRGLCVGSEPVELLPIDAAAAELGEAIRRALSAVREGVAHPADWQAQLAPLFKVAGIKSWDALQKSAKLCSIEAIDGPIRITPSRNGGTTGDGRGYHPMNEKAVILPPDATAAELGAAVLRAVPQCS